MEIFLNQMFSAPMVYFSVPFVFLMLYWLMVFAGLADFEMLDFDADVDPDSEAGGSSWLEKLGLDGVPLTVAITLLDIYALALTYLARKYLMPLFDGILTATAMGALVALFAVVIALPIAALSIRPLRQYFKTHEGVSKNDLIGTICTTTTQTVTATFGQATSKDGMLYSVRCAEPNDIKKGSRIVLIEYQSEADVFSVVTESELREMSSVPE